ncbi:hypothetical protein YC2023_117386 [Brassica napus]
MLSFHKLRIIQQTLSPDPKNRTKLSKNLQKNRKKKNRISKKTEREESYQLELIRSLQLGEDTFLGPDT